jgi:putative oxidoreductase
MDIAGGARRGFPISRGARIRAYVERTMELDGRAKLTSWMLQLLVAAILAQTLFFKFSAAPESVYIFSRLGAEPWGRIGSGVAELVAVVLLLVPSTVASGALLSLGVISGAILSHLTVLGISVVDADGSSDGGLLFALALVVALGSLAILAIRRREIPVLGRMFFSGGR